jgi:hypothetical protein
VPNIAIPTVDLGKCRRRREPVEGLVQRVGGIKVLRPERVLDFSCDLQEINGFEERGTTWNRW